MHVFQEPYTHLFHNLAKPLPFLYCSLPTPRRYLRGNISIKNLYPYFGPTLADGAEW